MVEEVHHELGLLCVLSAEVLVESSGLPAEAVRGVLVVVALQMGQQARSHVLMVWARSQTREHARASQLVEPSGDKPTREDDQREERTE